MTSFSTWNQVVLHIYDVGTDSRLSSLNRVLRPVGTGAFHAAVEVLGKEWSYGYGGAFSVFQFDFDGAFVLEPTKRANDQARVGSVSNKSKQSLMNRYCEGAGESGVFFGPPGNCAIHTFRESVPMGESSLSAQDIERVLDALRGGCVSACARARGGGGFWATPPPPPFQH